MPTTRIPAKSDSLAISTVGQGFLTQSWERSFNTNHNAMTTGTNRYTAIPVRGGQTYTNILVEVNVVGTTLTLVKFGLVSLDGVTLLAATADVKGTYTTGLNEIAFAATYTPAADAVVMAGVCATFSGTAPSYEGTAALSASSNAKTGKAFPFAGVAAQTDFVGGVTLAASSSPYWFALS